MSPRSLTTSARGVPSHSGSLPLSWLTVLAGWGSCVQKIQLLLMNFHFVEFTFGNLMGVAGAVIPLRFPEELEGIGW